MEARPFILHRIEDPSGISGTGLVAHGLRHADGSATVWWLGKHATTATHQTMASVIALHCHGGKSIVRWCDRVNGEWSIPYGEDDGCFAWTTFSTPFRSPGWIWAPSIEPTWHGRFFESYEPRLVPGDHLFAVEQDGHQIRVADDGTAIDRITLVQLLATASKVWVSRRIPETGGDPAAVSVSLPRRGILVNSAKERVL